ncbi:MAG: MFS transporter, partial [Alphaproteobacteria bacterium]
IEAWAWRIPFLVGLIIIPVAIYIRRRLEETEAFRNAKREEAASGKRVSIGELLANSWRETVLGIGLVAAATVTVYITFTYLVTFATKILNLPLQETFEVQMLGAFWVVILTPLMGILSDRIGRSRLLITSLAVYFVILFPLYSWLTSAPSIARLIVVQLATGLCAAGFFAVFSTVMAVLFPTRVRSLGLSISYNLAVMLIGGFAQFIVTWLIQQTGSPMAPTYYVMFGVGLGLISALILGKRADSDEHF